MVVMEYEEMKFKKLPSVTITGTAVDVRDRRTVLLTITDINGNTVTTTAITSDETYVVNGVDLSSLTGVISRSMR
ncbi:hypothetical protein OK016_25200 [Vibrio chagasii]|nr:hypothetical protein [Vibrio chagasii]